MEELTVVKKENAMEVFTKEGGIDPYIEGIKKRANEELEKLNKAGLDMSKDKDRKALSSLAYTVTRSKTAMDEAGKALKEKLMTDINPIDPSRKKSREELEKLIAKIKKPVEEWKAIEKEREQNLKDMLGELREKGNLEEMQNLNDDGLLSSLSYVEGIKIPDYAGDVKDSIELAQIKAIGAIKGEIESRKNLAEKAKKEEEEKKAKAEKKAKEEAEKLRKEGEEKAKKEAEEKAKVEAEKVATEKKKAKEREEKAIAEKATAEKVAKEAIESARIAKEKAEVEKVEAAKLAEKAKAKAVSDAKEAEAKRVADEAKAIEEGKKKREADTKHRKTINNAIMKGLMEIDGMTEDIAKEVIIKTVKREIANITINY